jgi:hypothetical protein
MQWSRLNSAKQFDDAANLMQDAVGRLLEHKQVVLCLCFLHMAGACLRCLPDQRCWGAGVADRRIACEVGKETRKGARWSVSAIEMQFVADVRLCFCEEMFIKLASSFPKGGEEQAIAFLKAALKYRTRA